LCPVFLYNVHSNIFHANNCSESYTVDVDRNAYKSSSNAYIISKISPYQISQQPVQCFFRCYLQTAGHTDMKKRTGTFFQLFIAKMTCNNQHPKIYLWRQKFCQYSTDFLFLAADQIENTQTYYKICYSKHIRQQRLLQWYGSIGLQFVDVVQTILPNFYFNYTNKLEFILTFMVTYFDEKNNSFYCMFTVIPSDLYAKIIW
jgi:hypothetical protein